MRPVAYTSLYLVLHDVGAWAKFLDNVARHARKQQGERLSLQKFTRWPA